MKPTDLIELIRLNAGFNDTVTYYNKHKYKIESYLDKEVLEKALQEATEEVNKVIDSFSFKKHGINANVEIKKNYANDIVWKYFDLLTSEDIEEDDETDSSSEFIN